jgi:hypothetical protein
MSDLDIHTTHHAGHRRRVVIPDAENRATIKFAEDLVPLVMSGQKKLTYRLGSRFSTTKKGDRLQVVDRSGRVLAVVEVIQTSVVQFNELPLCAEGHESYGSKAEQIQIFSQYYGYIPRPEEPVIILEFVLT